MTAMMQMLWVSVVTLVVGIGLGAIGGFIYAQRQRTGQVALVEVESPEAKPEVSRFFLDWVKHGLLDKTLGTNYPGSRVYFVQEGVFMLLPNLIDMFIRTHHQFSDESVKSIKNSFCKYLEKRKALVRTEVGLATHTYEFKAGSRSSILNGFLVPYHLIFNDDASNIEHCRYMRNISGFHESTHAKDRVQNTENTLRRLKAV